MHQASLYHRANNAQRHDAKQILEEYANIIQWRPEGRDTLIDIGCGSGDVLIDFVYPLMPVNFEQLLGTDISAKMIAYARKCYADFERTKFKILDIGCEKIPSELNGCFDHVTSFYCLHWVQNQKQALQNIFKLLRPQSGDCLLVFLATNRVYDAYRRLSTLNKWSSYMQDVEQFISPLHNSKDPSSDFSKLLQDAGFADYTVEIRNEVYVYEGVKNVKDNVKAICPFFERIPEQQHEDFLDDFVSTVVSMKLYESNGQGTDYKFISPYKLVVAYARKCSDFVSNVIGGKHVIKGLN
ncbi:juvenile hormone acid O-methyltransferase [Teleopsis dalmanni]|uniref:juvenile hormone acid O-methyltransferase n=1 Tax=Teleopsis dalmanni TaxID=139649 RepID=UPI0018CE461E|nr:juvenile hormone acid O-methyltransferase [Teleopsis dalmanni]